MAIDTHALTTLANLKSYLGVTTSTDDTIMEDSINRATVMIESLCDRKLKARQFFEFCDASGERTFTVDNFPIIDVNSISYGSQLSFTVSSSTASTDVLASVSNDGEAIRLRKVDANGAETTSTVTFETFPTSSQVVTQINDNVSGWTASLQRNAYGRSLYRFGGRGVIDSPAQFDYPRDSAADYRVDYATGLIHLLDDSFPPVPGSGDRANRFPPGFLPVFVEYRAGYETVPRDLEQIAIELASELFNERLDDKSMQSEALGGYNYTKADGEKRLMERLRSLDMYREIR